MTSGSPPLLARARRAQTSRGLTLPQALPPPWKFPIPGASLLIKIPLGPRSPAPYIQTQVRFFRALPVPQISSERPYAIVTISGITVTQQNFVGVQSVDPDDDFGDYDGILGLGFPHVEALRTNFFQTAMEEGKVAGNSFGLRLDTADSEAQLHLGGGDRHQYTGKIEEHAVDASEGFWQLNDASVLAGDNVAVSGIKVVFDSGSDVMYGPDDEVCLPLL